ncbi:hypothetical protein SAMD00019534_088610, partial [Acytostelium subglobosum LB1]|uniref:hypothetical protein n=1 Tax=Acytostelium subglobosum LB1 TaxID=1410327 RepID=UPI000644DB7B
MIVSQLIQRLRPRPLLKHHHQLNHLSSVVLTSKINHNQSKTFTSLFNHHRHYDIITTSYNSFQLSMMTTATSTSTDTTTTTAPAPTPITASRRMLPKSMSQDWERFHTHTLAGIFRGVPDIFEGITVEDTTQYPDDVATFEQQLKDTLKYWIENKRRGIWIKIPQSKSQFIPVLVAEQFSFHHCQEDYLMLTRWLPSDANRLPDYTSHFIGCGGLVINEKNEILLITEKQRPDRWKIPGGALDAGEDICKTPVREVFEETGVRTEFVSVLGFRQIHNYAFNRGDIYYVCALRALSTEINIDPNEIAKCKWAPVSEFIAMGNKESFPLQRSVARLAHEYVYNGYKGFKASEVANSLIAGNSFVYHGSDADFTDLMYKEPAAPGAQSH